MRKHDPRETGDETGESPIVYEDCGHVAGHRGAPTAAVGEAGEMMRWLGKENGEAMTPFSFVQLSDAHVGFNGPPDPLGTKAFERAVELINGLPAAPELVLFTGDLTHDTEEKDIHARRMKQFQEICSRMKVGKLMYVPGEHDAGLDGGQLYRKFFRETHYSFDHRGVHFVALDNVSRAKPEVGPEQLAWLKNDLARFPKTAPIVVFTHRPLFDLKPEWEWFTSDGDDVMNVLAPYQNVTVFYEHIHRDHEHEEGNAPSLRGAIADFCLPRSGQGGGEETRAIRQRAALSESGDSQGERVGDQGFVSEGCRTDLARVFGDQWSAADFEGAGV
jgi:3',5'-cyclic AMP phosphodiesterase CpdA